MSEDLIYMYRRRGLEARAALSTSTGQEVGEVNTDQFAENAAIQGEAVKVVACIDLDTDAGVVLYANREPHLDAELLMTVAQHERIVAAQQRAAVIPAEKPLPELMMASYHEAIGWNACRQAMLAALSAQQSAHAGVPRERIKIALEAVQNAMEDAYNNAYQSCCGRGIGQCCGDPEPAWSDADHAIMDALAPAQRELSALLSGGEA